MFAFVEGTVAHGTVAHACTRELFLFGEAEHPGFGADGEDNGPALELSSELAAELPDAVFLPDGGHFLQFHFGALFHGLLHQLIAELGAADGNIAREIFHAGRPGDLPAEGVAFQNQNALARAAGVDRRRQAGRAAAYYNNIVQHRDQAVWLSICLMAPAPAYFSNPFSVNRMSVGACFTAKCFASSAFSSAYSFSYWKPALSR